MRVWHPLFQVRALAKELVAEEEPVAAVVEAEAAPVNYFFLLGKFNLPSKYENNINFCQY